MSVYHLHQKQFFPLKISEAWDFFSSPANLVKITPAYMDFNILYLSGERSKMYAGQIISYRVKLLPFIYLRWVSEITHVREPHYFVDKQIKGPFSIWHHQHFFREVNDGVEMTDEITYTIPFGIIGKAVHYFFVERQLKAIFNFRQQTIKTYFYKEKVTP